MLELVGFCSQTNALDKQLKKLISSIFFCYSCLHKRISQKLIAIIFHKDALTMIIPNLPFEKSPKVIVNTRSLTECIANEICHV